MIRCFIYFCEVIFLNYYSNSDIDKKGKKNRLIGGNIVNVKHFWDIWLVSLKIEFDIYLGLRRKVKASNIDFNISCIKMVFKAMGQTMKVKFPRRWYRVGSGENREKI